jgi:hypothetical protein
MAGLELRRADDPKLVGGADGLARIDRSRRKMVPKAGKTTKYVPSPSTVLPKLVMMRLQEISLPMPIGHNYENRTRNEAQ